VKRYRHTIDKTSVLNFLREHRVEYASSTVTLGRRRLFVTLQGCFIVEYAKEIIYEGMDIDRAIEEFSNCFLIRRLNPKRSALLLGTYFTLLSKTVEICVKYKSNLKYKS
jgi:hypothetical protein